MSTAEQSRDRKKKLKTTGMCVSCGQKPVEVKKTYCSDCLIKFRNRIREQRVSWAKQGLCSRCGKHKSSSGKKMCQVCLDTDMKKRRALKLETFNRYGGPICSCCGETHQEFLCIDHIGGWGGEHRRQDPSVSTIYRWLKKNNYPPGFRVLCHNCNMSLGAFGYCPHDK